MIKIQGDPDEVTSIDYDDYYHSNVYILVKKIDQSKPLKLQIQYQYHYNPPIPIYVWILLGIFLTFFTIALVILILYKLHKKEIIEVVIPKKFRIYCFKNYISKQELADIKNAKMAQIQFKIKQELIKRLAM